MTVDVAPSPDNRVGAGATTERPAFAAVVVQIKQASRPAEVVQQMTVDMK